MSTPSADTYLDEIVGRDVEFPIVSHASTTAVMIRVSGGTPGHIDLVVEVIDDLRSGLDERTWDRWFLPDSDILTELGARTIGDAAHTVLSPLGHHARSDISVEPTGAAITAVTTSVQGETLQQWLDRTGQESADVLGSRELVRTVVEHLTRQ